MGIRGSREGGGSRKRGKEGGGKGKTIRVIMENRGKRKGGERGKEERKGRRRKGGNHQSYYGK